MNLRCCDGEAHWWGYWHLISDPINIDAGDTDGFVYYRECNKMWCSVRQKVKSLEPDDSLETYAEYEEPKCAKCGGDVEHTLRGWMCIRGCFGPDIKTEYTTP